MSATTKASLKAAGLKPLIGGSAFPRSAALLTGAVVGFAIVGLSAILMPTGSLLGVVLFDNRAGAWPAFPFTIQSLSWVAFAIGLGDLAWLYSLGLCQRNLLARGLLPEEPDIMIDSDGLRLIARGIKPDERSYFLPQTLLRAIWQFESTRSVSQASSVMNQSLELCEHEVDLQYSLARFLSWFIPTLGFIGTVLGISRALGNINIEPGQLETMAETFNAALSDIGTAFNTTLVALLLSSVLVFITNRLEERDERTIVEIGRYCIDHLINKIYVPERKTL